MIEIVFGIDSKYVKYCAVTAASILSNHKNTDSANKIKFYFLSPQYGAISQADKENLLKLREIQDFDYEFINIAGEEYAGLPQGSKITLAAYNRLLIPELLPPDVTKALYLDSDIIAVGDIQSLWDFDVENYLLGAVRDYSRKNQDKNYYNSGVLLLNLKALREFGFYERWKKFVKELDDPSSLTFFDQDILNAVTKGKVLLLPKEYNALPCYAAGNVKNVVIAHFPGFKPWDAFCIHPMRELYWRYAGKTAWKIKKQSVSAYLFNFIKKQPLFFIKPKYWKLAYGLVRDKIRVAKKN